MTMTTTMMTMRGDRIALVLLVVSAVASICGCPSKPSDPPAVVEPASPWKDLMSGQVSSLTLVGDRLDVLFQDGSRFTVRMGFLDQNEATLSKGTTVVLQYWNTDGYTIYRFVKKTPERPDGAVQKK